MNIYETLPAGIQQLIDKKKKQHTKTIPEEKVYMAPDQAMIEDAAVALAQGKNILLKGPTGSGKTTFAETLSGLFQNPMHMINCSVDLDAESLLGFKTLQYNSNHEQEIVFVPGPVVQAMEKGEFLYIDEINMAKPETLPILNSVLDYRKSLTNPFTSETVKAKEGFGVIAAVNEGYIGTTPLNEALKNRFIVIDVPYIEGETLRNVLKEQSLISDSEHIEFFIALSKDLIQATRQGTLSEEAASVRALLDAADLSVAIPLKRAVQRAIIDKLDEDREKEFLDNIVEMLLP
ncbi:ATP-binding protein [Bacillus testis]|uniref:ATP-binding protein n=1 Tax=Bacillus testis TaxID=1622072 RepID=UPI00067F5659|nr:MoxR family ATPase [Bacillus testis]